MLSIRWSGPQGQEWDLYPPFDDPIDDYSDRPVPGTQARC